MEEVLQNDSNTFFLNNLLMSVQFFENYDRDIEHLRKTWYEEFSIEPHHKKCFYADSLFRLVGRRVKFSPRHGANKNLVFELHPLRIYISSDNVEAAYDPSALRTRQRCANEPHYQFTVKPAEESEESGCITLVELKRREPANKNRRPHTLANVNGINGAEHSDKTVLEDGHGQKKYNFDEEPSRRVAKAENPTGVDDGDTKGKASGRRSLRFLPHHAEGAIPVNGLYKFAEQGPRPRLRDFRMNSAPTTGSLEIPTQCFQMEEVKKKINSRRTALRECFGGQKVLNGAAFKGHFCDLLLEQLSESLNLDPKDVDESVISDEFVVVNQAGAQFCIAPIITIRDWNNFVATNKKFGAVGKTEEVVWPSKYMQKIISLLPCNAVPTGHSQSEQSTRNQKTWSLVFPKAEEFLLLHMMHAHVRCYLFALLLYKSFIETEINAESLGPKHLMHLLFWRVHKNFFAWPEDRPAETLINFLKMLYKKLQNKSLCDFFITSRNLFACSRARDLHKAQALIKKILEDPVVYISRAVRNLKLEEGYYPAFDVVKLISAANLMHGPACKGERTRGDHKEKKVHFQEDEEALWKKAVIKRIKVEKELEEQERLSRLSVESIQVPETSDFKSQDPRKCNRILEMFTSHFVQMGIKSLEYNFTRQALFYLSQSEKVFELMLNNETDGENLKPTIEGLGQLKATCYGQLKKELPEFPSKEFQAASEQLLKNLEDFQAEDERMRSDSISHQVNPRKTETIDSDEEEFDVDEDKENVTVKL